jgi:hypothetical protein
VARARWNADARGFDRRMALFEGTFYGDGREWVCSRAHGNVLEVAVGSRRNLRRYSPAVQLTGIDLSQSMVDLANARALAWSAGCQGLRNALSVRAVMLG